MPDPENRTRRIPSSEFDKRKRFRHKRIAKKILRTLGSIQPVRSQQHKREIKHGTKS